MMAICLFWGQSDKNRFYSEIRLKVFENIRLDIKKDDVFRLLGKKRNGRFHVRTEKRLDEFIDKARSIVRPKLVYSTRRINKVERHTITIEGGISFKSGRLSKSIGKCDKVAVFLATVGKKLDDMIHSLMKQRKMADAYMYDAIGSAAVEETVESFQRGFDSLAEKSNERSTLRFSPGYCDWRIQEQEKLFSVVDSELVGIQLSPGCLMTPRKSVSGVFGIGSVEEIDKSRNNPCEQCNMHSCIARRVS